MAALVVAPRQAEDLRDCRPGDCGMKLSAAAISELQALRGSSGRVSSEAASRVLRDLLLRAAEAYRREGPAGLVTYVDRPGRSACGTPWRP